MRCRFSSGCSGFRVDAATCRDGGGDYCGLYRKLDAETPSLWGRLMGFLDWGRGFRDDLRAARLRGVENQIKRIGEKRDEAEWKLDKLNVELMRLLEEKRKLNNPVDGFLG